MSSLAYVPAWREDETVFSWCCFYHAVAGNLSARDTGAVLFGVEHACRERWAPLHLRHLAARVGDALGSPASMLTQRTPLALFWPFLTLAKRSEILQAVDVGAGIGWTTAIGMPASALAATDLRYCESCVDHDLGAYGVPRWRLSHQLSGAWVCTDHGEPLRIFQSRASKWILPGNSSGKTQSALGPDISMQEISHLVRLATLARAVAGGDVLDLDAIRAAALALLREHGVIGWAYPIDKQRLATWFASSPLAGALRHVRSAERRLEGGLWVHDLLRRRCADHPLKWMSLWTALHASNDEENIAGFLAPASVSVAWNSAGQGCFWPSTCDALAAQIGAYFANGVDLKSAAQKLGLSTFALRRQLKAAEIDAQRVGQALQWERRRRQWARAVRDFIQGHPGCSRSDVHSACKAAVTWLGREAPTDLRRELSAITDQRGRQRPFVFSSDSPGN